MKRQVSHDRAAQLETITDLLRADFASNALSQDPQAAPSARQRDKQPNDRSAMFSSEASRTAPWPADQNSRDGNRAAESPSSPADSNEIASPDRAAENWQRRQIELLERIDESLRRLRELQESARSSQSAFTDPAYF